MTDRRLPRRFRSDLIRLLAIAVIPALILFLVLLRWCLSAGIKYHRIWRDLAQIYDAPIGEGVISTIGYLLWAAAAAICLFTAGAGLAPHRWRALLLSGGSLSLLLCLDDTFLLHDRHISETFLYLLYAVLALVILVRFRDLLVEADLPAFLAASGLMGFSIIIDKIHLGSYLNFVFFQIPIPGGITSKEFWEEGAKFIGIVCWLYFWCRAASRAATLRLNAARP